ncbi:MAG: hemolysin III family protein [Dehalococcoidia bacterium]
MAADGQAARLPGEERPALRGWIHVAALLAVVAGAALLLVVADSARAYVGGAIFAASLFLLYGTSATYHRVQWSPTARRVVKRLDHAMIFVLIAGTYTPLCLHVSLAWGIPMLSVVWGIAGAGIVLKLFWPDGPRWLSVALYVALGWLALAAVSELVTWFSPVELAMLGLGGALYTVGGLVYAVRRPDPWPRVFGYHEIFHLFVVAGSALHYSLVVIVVLPS